MKTQGKAKKPQRNSKETAKKLHRNCKETAKKPQRNHKETENKSVISKVISSLFFQNKLQRVL